MNERVEKLFKIIKATNGFDLALASLDDHEYDLFIEAYAKSLLERVDNLDEDYEDTAVITLKTGLDVPSEHFYPWSDTEIRQAIPYYPAFKLEELNNKLFNCGIVYYRNEKEYYYPILSNINKEVIITKWEHVAKKIKFYLEHEQIKIK